MLISDEYRKLQRELHRRYDYGRGVDTPEVIGILRILHPVDRPARVLDYGCGQGSLRRAIERDERLAQMLTIWEYDPAVKGKEAVPDRPSHYVVCADVLEHIEPECLRDVLAHLAACTSETCIMVIATNPSKKVMADGRQAHICLMTAQEWLDVIQEHFEVGIFQDRTRQGRGLLVLGRPHVKA